MNSFKILFLLSLPACFGTCGKPSHLATPKELSDANRLYQFIEKYESFGPKVPASVPHKNAGDWILKTLQDLHLKTHEQNGIEQKTPVRNLIAQWAPEKPKRILLSAHWDNRPHADEEHPATQKPVPGVNDGGSGVAVLLEIATLVSKLDPKESLIGIDFFFWDAEDGGTPAMPETYCLGSQYWGKNRWPENYTAQFGINFDMVGRIGTKLPRERYSERVAMKWVDAIWESAKKVNAAQWFGSHTVGPVVDDHVFIHRLTGIPVVDLIYMDESGSFASEWHTLNDTSEFISRDVLKGITDTTLTLLFSDKIR